MKGASLTIFWPWWHVACSLVEPRFADLASKLEAANVPAATKKHRLRSRSGKGTFLGSCIVSWNVFSVVWLISFYHSPSTDSPPKSNYHIPVMMLSFAAKSSDLIPLQPYSQSPDDAQLSNPAACSFSQSYPERELRTKPKQNQVPNPAGLPRLGPGRSLP